MAFKPLRKKRERGKGFQPGFIKKKIVLIIAKQFPKGMKEPDLRDTLREEYGVSEPKGVKIHLAELEEKGVLIKEEKKGRTNLWKLNQSYETFKYLVKEFYKSKNDEFEEDDICKFMRSEYFQSIVDENFVDHFAAEWWKEYARFINLQYPNKSVEEFNPDELKKEFYGHLVGLDKDNLIQILRLSPSCLHNFLFPKENIPASPSVSLSAYFLFPFVADIMVYSVPDGKGIETKLNVEYGDVKNIRGEIKVLPTIKVKSQFGILNMKGVEKNANNP